MTTVSLDSTTAGKFILPESFSRRDFHMNRTLVPACLARVESRPADGLAVAHADRSRDADR